MSSRFKKVSVKKCISLVIFSIVAALLFAFIPFSFGTEDGLIFTYKLLPVLSKGEISLYITKVLNAIAFAIPTIPVQVLEIIYIVFNYGIYAIMLIFVLDLVFGLLLAITRSNVLRIIFKILGIFMGIAMILSMLLFIIYLIGSICLLISGVEFLTVLKTQGFILAVVMIVICPICAKKNFSSFNLAD